MIEEYGCAIDIAFRRVGRGGLAVNGNNDVAANGVVEEESKILMAHGCKIAVFSFEGAHQVAPPEHTTDALRWILTGK